MQHDPEFIQGLVAAWREAYRDNLTDDQIVDRFDEILNLYVRMREIAGPLAGHAGDARPQQVIPYIVAGDRLLTMTDLDAHPFTIKVPHGYAEAHETLHETALRIAAETELGRCLLVAEVGGDEQNIDGKTIDRHFYLVEAAASARKRSWVVEHGDRRTEYSWMNMADVPDLPQGLDDFLDDLPQAA